MIWFTSDPHWRHRKICEFTDRQRFTTPEQHDQWLTDLWNREVSPLDTVYMLGDVVFNCRKIDVFKEQMDKLNGTKIIIRGNHDDRKVLDQSGLEWYDLKKITVSHEFEGAPKKQQIIMCHYALAIWEGAQHGSWNLYGHSHGNLQFPKGKRLDVGIDNAYNVFKQHKLFSLREVHDYMKTREFEVVDHHTDKTNQ